MSSVRPAGTPSMMVTRALPCDSPAVKKRSMRCSFYLKYLPHPGNARSSSPQRRLGRWSCTSVVMQLVADRFAAHEDGRVFDLSTGALVTLVIGSAGGVSEQLRWVERCDAFRALR